jgi:hypothetical protein
LLCAPGRAAVAATISGALTVRAEGRAPIQQGRVDIAYDRALEEAFRRGLLEALHAIAPERQSPQDLETWQETVLPRAGDFVGAWRIVAEEQKDGFLTLEAEIDVWRDKLARAARATRASAAAPTVRVVVLAEPLPLIDPAADEEVDAGRTAAAALEAELARRGAVVVATSEPAPWVGGGPASEENRVALAAAAARRLEADAVLIVQVARRGTALSLAVQLVAVGSESTLASARADVGAPGEHSLAEAFAPAARQLAALCAPHLAAARRGRSAAP